MAKGSTVNKERTLGGNLRLRLTVKRIPQRIAGPKNLKTEWKMMPSFTKNQGVGTADLDYSGSSFLQVRNNIFENPYYEVWGGAFEPPLPVHQVSFTSVFWGAIPLPFKTDNFGTAAKRTVDSKADLRPGSDGKGFRRIVHPNGVCLTGVWKIDEDASSGHSGYFAPGSTGLIVARLSTASSDTFRDGPNKSFSIVGKVFPTMDKNEVVEPANFITQSNLGAVPPISPLDAKMQNTPDIQAFGRGLEVAILLRTNLALMKGDRIPAQRQVYSIAELGNPSRVRTPRFMQIEGAEENFRSIRHNDFRDEILSYFYDPGVRYDLSRHICVGATDSSPDGIRANSGRTLKFNIRVSDNGNPTGTMANRKWAIRNWKTIGSITFNEAVVSRNGDQVIHFHHSPWRDNRDDPATTALPPR